eukprot:CAMPEP_0173427598 /NCGR_PEP_ID=MMETSP1357-20121228/6770_1 /TAXON_ID=77926 /ORGANISM="Hemiselmis rufescens, Strain PCC563" /LENGTH=42 /DNA_ID= /DNA_START= /DNA_END= /DNA_ORIENTATION=
MSETKQLKLHRGHALHTATAWQWGGSKGLDSRRSWEARGKTA